MVETQDKSRAGVLERIKVFEILQVLLRRKVLVLSITVLTGLLSCCYSLTLPNIYAATAKVLPPQKESSGINTVLGQIGGVAAMAAKGSENELYVSLVRSRTVGSAVIERLGLIKLYHAKGFPEAYRRLDASVKALAGRDGILNITVEDSDPKLAALIANTLVDELGRALVRLNLSKVGSERLFLEKRLEVVNKDLKAAEEDLKAFAQQHKITQVESQASASVSNVARLENELNNKQVQLEVLRTSQSDDSYQVKELQAAIRRLKQNLAAVAGKGGAHDGIPAIGDVPSLGLEYARKQRELKTQETLFEQLTKQNELAKLNQAKDTSSMQVLDEAVPPEMKSRPKRSVIVIMATLIAFIASVVLVFVLEYLEKMPDQEREALVKLKREALRLS